MTKSRTLKVHLDHDYFSVKINAGTSSKTLAPAQQMQLIVSASRYREPSHFIECIKWLLVNEHARTQRVGIDAEWVLAALACLGTGVGSQGCCAAADVSVEQTNNTAHIFSHKKVTHSLLTVRAILVFMFRQKYPTQ